MIFKRLFPWRSPTGETVNRVPEGRRVYAVGDIHGRLDLLDELLKQIDTDDKARGQAQTTLIFLGDLIDRGEHSKGVIERLMALSSSRHDVHFLLGNHEQVFLRAIAGDPRATRLLVRIGGRETILSYGVPESEYKELNFEQLTEVLRREVPPDHVDFLSSFESWIEIGDYLFVHAGVRPGIAIEAQSVADLCWIRDEFLSYEESHGKMIVHGHSIQQDVDVRRNRIGIDTGAYASGRLTAIGLEGADRWFIST